MNPSAPPWVATAVDLAARTLSELTRRTGLGESETRASARAYPDSRSTVGAAMGHPVGATGARIVATLAYEMQRREARYGLGTVCIGCGQGLAAIFERTPVMRLDGHRGMPSHTKNLRYRDRGRGHLTLGSTRSDRSACACQVTTRSEQTRHVR